MKGVTALILSTVIFQVNAGELSANHNTDTQDFMDKLVDRFMDKLVDQVHDKLNAQVLQESPQPADLDRTTLMRTHPLMTHGSPFTRSMNPAPRTPLTSYGTLFPRNQAPRRDAASVNAGADLDALKNKPEYKSIGGPTRPVDKYGRLMGDPEVGVISIGAQKLVFYPPIAILAGLVGYTLYSLTMNGPPL